jgi:hypothetical protein
VDHDPRSLTRKSATVHRCDLSRPGLPSRSGVAADRRAKEGDARSALRRFLWRRIVAKEACPVCDARAGADSQASLRKANGGSWNPRRSGAKLIARSFAAYRSFGDASSPKKRLALSFSNRSAEAELSVTGTPSQSGKGLFYPVADPRNDDGMPVALNPAPAFLVKPMPESGKKQPGQIAGSKCDPAGRCS